MKKNKYEYLADDPNVKVMPIMVTLIIGAFFAILNDHLLKQVDLDINVGD